MRLIDSRAARRGLACAVAAALCLGPTLTGVRAQDAAPVSGPAAVASGGEEVLLRAGPSYEAAVLAPVGDGNALEVTGEAVAAADGTSWLAVVAGGQSGYVPAGYVVTAPAALPAAPIAAEPGVVEPVAAPEPPATTPDPAMAPAAGPSNTTTETNVRAWPGADADIVAVLPPNTPLSVDGPAENGFVPVSGNGGSGWVAADLLAGGAPAAPAPVTAPSEPPPLVAPEPAGPEPLAPVTEPPAPVPAEPADAAPSNESTGIIWPFAGGEWEVVQGYNNGTHTNRSGFATYKYSLDWARTDGKTAGEPVYAPVTGAIQWTDRGSGGLLIDAGNGYGVALFHVTLDRGVARGGSVEQGQRIGKISGPGGDGYMSMAHVDITCWRLTNGGGHEAVPFTGPNAIAGQEFPDIGGGNQHMGATVNP